MALLQMQFQVQGHCTAGVGKMLMAIQILVTQEVTSGIPTPWINKYILVYTLWMGPYTMPYDIMTCNRITHYRILEHSGLLEHTGTY